MRAFFRMLKPLPKVGDIYVFDDDVDPWSDRRHKVEILDVAPGWVRYKFCGSEFLTDLRATRSSFHFCYKKTPNAS